MSPVKLRWKFWLAGALTLSCALYVGVYTYGVHSDAFEFSEVWLTQSSEVRERVGSVGDVQLSLWGGFSEEIRGDYRRALLVAEVTGSKGSIEAETRAGEKGCGMDCGGVPTG